MSQVGGRARQGFGCWLEPDELSEFVDSDASITADFTGNAPIIPKSGDPMFDLALAQTLTKISEIFDVLPGFGFFDDYEGPNAFASPDVRMHKTDGTVLFGTNLLRKVRSVQEAPEVAVAAVCAHEFGHTLQSKRRLRDQLLAGQPTVKRLELHADFMAGVFAGFRKKEKPSYPAAVFAVTQHSFGDVMFGSFQHHGTPDERANAIIEGFNTVKLKNLNIDQAALAGVNYVFNT
ncbi:MAG TPA: hypothetical protein VKS44_10520 [Candidatus Acidoferrales bacterium]|nr:hypothetical protein [Candidatus Acidoferrales bacterium]